MTHGPQCLIGPMSGMHKGHARESSDKGSRGQVANIAAKNAKKVRRAFVPMSASRAGVELGHATYAALLFMTQMRTASVGVIRAKIWHASRQNDGQRQNTDATIGNVHDIMGCVMLQLKYAPSTSAMGGVARSVNASAVTRLP